MSNDGELMMTSSDYSFDVDMFYYDEQMEEEATYHAPTKIVKFTNASPPPSEHSDAPSVTSQHDHIDVAIDQCIYDLNMNSLQSTMGDITTNGADDEEIDVFSLSDLFVDSKQYWHHVK